MIVFKLLVLIMHAINVYILYNNYYILGFGAAVSSLGDVCTSSGFLPIRIPFIYGVVPGSGSGK